MQLVILGMHRSGTSALARILNMMGAYFGPDGVSTGANQENPKGFWERRDVRRLNDLVLHSAGCDWDKVSNFTLEKVPEEIKNKFRIEAAKILLEMDSHRPWLLKEPRLCLLFELWKELLELPICVHINRNPVEVAKSLYTRNKIPIHVGIALWEKYNVMALEASRGLPRVVVSHHKLMKDPVSEVNNLYEQLIKKGVRGLQLPSQNEIKLFIQDDLYREKIDCKLNWQYLSEYQSKIFDGLNTGKILNSREKLVVSEFANLVLSDYESAIKKSHELRAAREVAQRQEAEFKQRLAEQREELAQKIIQIGKEKESLQEIISNMELEIKSQEMKLSLIKMGVIEFSEYMAQNDKIVKQLISGINSLISTRRWKFGNALFSLKYKLTFRKKPEMAVDYLQKVVARYQESRIAKCTMQVNLLDIFNADFSNYSDIGEFKKIYGNNRKQNKKILREGIERNQKKPILNATSSSAIDFISRIDKKRNISLCDTVGIHCSPVSNVGVLREYKYSKINNKKERGIISVIVPIFNGYEDVKKCIESVIENTQCKYELVLVNDASTDERISWLLNDFDRRYDFVRVINNSVNLGYTASINIACKTCKGDVVLLNSDTIVTKNWLSKLHQSAYSKDNICTVTPLSNSAGAFSIPIRGEDNVLPDGITIEMMAEIVEKKSRNIRPQVPTGNGFCMYIRKDCIERVGLFDEVNFPVGYCEENDFCMRAIKKGFIHIIDDATFVFHKRSVSFGDKKAALIKKNRQTLDKLHPEFKARVDQWLNNDELNDFREDIKREVDKGINKRKILIILHDGEGGTKHTTNDLVLHFPGNYDVEILKTNINYWYLYKHDGSDRNLCKKFEFEKAWRIQDYLTKDREGAIKYILERTDYDLVHIRHIIASSPEIIDIIKKYEKPIVFSFHDFYTICPTIQLLNHKGEYCEGICDVQKSNDCGLARSWFKEPLKLKDEYVHEWRTRVSRALNKVNSCITTSESTKNIILKFYPFLESRFQIIEHGRDFEGYKSCIDMKKPRNKILVFGALGPSKGIFLINEILKINKKNETGIEFHFLGNKPDYFQPEEYGGIYHGTYKRENLPVIVNAIKPSYSLILSIWPETFCHTLTESWALGLPAFVSNLGALRERLIKNGGGWLLDYRNPKRCYDDIIKIVNDDDEYYSKITDIKNMSFKSARQMAEEYCALYENEISKNKARVQQ